MILTLFLLCVQIGGFISSLHAVMATRTPQGAIAWVISLNTFPVIALPAYWIFGRNNFRGYVVARKEQDAQLRELITELVHAYPQVFSKQCDLHSPIRAAEELARVPVMKGNDVKLLIDGEDTFLSILEGIQQAGLYILVQFYTVRDDSIGRKLQAALIEKAHAGVRVYILFDEVGSHKLPHDYLEKLRDAGVEIHPFNSRKGWRNRFQLNFRNHRKVVVVDGHTSWMGGHNVGDEYLDGGGAFTSWRDTHIKIEGPASLPVQFAFMEDWKWATDSRLDLDWERGFEITPGEKDVLILPTGPADDRESAALMFTHAINNARDRIWIASPYFVPDEGVIQALQLAVLRGVEVRILIPDLADHHLAYLAAFSSLKQVGDGIRIWRYTEGFMHQKVVLVDHNIASVGTANFDNRSFRLNFEITAMILDKSFNREVEEMLLRDFERSIPMEANALDHKSYPFQLMSRFSSLFAPIL
ncbi:MAG: cardiolipin synthase [Kiritimatiellia bacterium]